MLEIKEKINNINIVIATHVYTTGPSQDLRDYLLKNDVGELLFIGHPLFYNKNLKGSGYDLYKRGLLVISKYGVIKRSNQLIEFIKVVILDIYYVIAHKKKYGLYFGVDNLNALAGLFLKMVGLVNKVIYYVIDYNPKRFPNKILNLIYHKIDQICVRYSDETWNLSPRMEEARKKYFNFSIGNQKVVPVGVWFDRIKRKEFSDIEKLTLVFMGHITKKQGIQHVIEAIPKIAKEIPDFKFIIIGGGDYLDELKVLTKKLSIVKQVKFTNYIKDHKDIEDMLSSCALAIALYEKYDENGNLSFTYFADPAKLKIYMACGLPVLLTDVSYNAKEIEENKCGIIIDYDKEMISAAIVELMKNEVRLRQYRENAINYIVKFDWSLIFQKNLERIFNETLVSEI
ncbi:MAG: glycosyltransferase [Candidatus Humimicrobiaceae bacterium]